MKDISLVKTFVVMIICMYLIISIVNNETDSNKDNKDNKDNKYKRYYRLDSMGDLKLFLPKEMNYKKKKEIFKRSLIFKEVIETFPFFTKMKKKIIKDVFDEEIKINLTKTVIDVEEKYISGIINIEIAKNKIKNF